MPSASLVMLLYHISALMRLLLDNTMVKVVHCQMLWSFGTAFHPLPSEDLLKD